jgi:hypothetical protein
MKGEKNKTKCHAKYEGEKKRRYYIPNEPREIEFGQTPDFLSRLSGSRLIRLSVQSVRPGRCEPIQAFDLSVNTRR